jgi:hypothetical protein
VREEPPPGQIEDDALTQPGFQQRRSFDIASPATYRDHARCQ